MSLTVGAPTATVVVTDELYETALLHSMAIQDKKFYRLAEGAFSYLFHE